jgi:hypothetical protein
MFQNFFLHIVNVVDTLNTASRRSLSVNRSLTSESLEARASSTQTMVDAIQRFVQPFLNARFQSCKPTFKDVSR